ncbi:hypothetical protein CUMW_285820, partial [Citrus unshiu]
MLSLLNTQGLQGQILLVLMRLYIIQRSVSNTEYGITEWIEERLSADKLVLCLPFYGYAWTLVKPKDNGIGAAATGPTLSDNGFVPY